MSDPAAQRIIDRIDFSRRGPTVLAYGVGVDSTAILVELEARGSLPDLVLTADTGTEKPETYEYQAMIAAWMAGICEAGVAWVPLVSLPVAPSVLSAASAPPVFALSAVVK